jgi:helix-turn-helix protein
LLFKDLNSKISLSTNLNVNKGFTLYFEVKFCKSKDVRVTAFEAVSYSNFYLETHFSEFSTIYFNEEENKDYSGIKILIQPY